MTLSTESRGKEKNIILKVTGEHCRASLYTDCKLVPGRKLDPSTLLVMEEVGGTMTPHPQSPRYQQKLN